MSIVCALAIGGCREPARPSHPASEASRAAVTSIEAPGGAPTSPSPSATGPCRADRAIDVASPEALPRAVSIATLPTGRGLVAFGSGPRTLTTAAFTDDRRPQPPRSVAFPLADRLLSITSVGPESFVAVAHGPCPDGTGQALCLSALALDRNGEPVGPARILPVRARIERLRRHGADGSLLLACSAAEGPPWLEILEAREDGLAHDRVALGRRFDPGERQADVLHVTTSGGEWAVLYRIGAIEDPEGEVVLSTPRGERALPALHEAAMIETAVLEREAFSTVATFEFGRPLVLRFDRLGRLRGEPDELARGAAPPPPFLARLSAILEDDGRALSLRPRTAIGDDVGEPVALAVRSLAAESAASVARVPDGFVVAYGEGSARGPVVRLRAVHCEETR